MFDKYFKNKGFEDKLSLYETVINTDSSETVIHDYTYNPTWIAISPSNIRIFKNDKLKKYIYASKSLGNYNFLKIREHNNIYKNPNKKFSVIEISKNVKFRSNIYTKYICSDIEGKLCEFKINNNEVLFHHEPVERYYKKCTVYYGLVDPKTGQIVEKPS